MYSMLTSLPNPEIPPVEPITGGSFWDLLSFLWNSAVEFLSSLEISFYNTGISFSVYECMIAVAIISILIYAVFRVLQ